MECGVWLRPSLINIAEIAEMRAGAVHEYGKTVRGRDTITEGPKRRGVLQCLTLIHFIASAFSRFRLVIRIHYFTLGLVDTLESELRLPSITEWLTVGK